MLDFPEWGAGTGAFRLADEVARLQAVVAVQNELSTSRAELPALMIQLATRAQEMTGATGAVVEAPEGDFLVCSAATGSGQPHLGLRVPIGASLSGLAFLTGEVLNSDDTKDDLRIDHDSCERLGVRSMIAVPLSSSHTSFGVLRVLSTSPCAFGPRARADVATGGRLHVGPTGTGSRAGCPAGAAGPERDHVGCPARK